MALPNFILKLVFTFFICLNAIGSSALASETKNWSFEDHPHPKYEDFSEEELDKLADIVGGAEKCATSIRYAYKLYQERYPEFSDYADFPDMFYRWQEHVMLQEQFALFCAYGNERQIIVDFSERPAKQPPLFFCGQFSNKPITTNEKEVVRAIDFLAHMIEQNEFYASAELLSLNAFFKNQTYSTFFPVISLNSDVEFALKVLLQLKANSTTYNDAKYSDLATPKSQLTPERIAFVEQAVKDGDLKRVFDTTAPCTLP